MNKIKISTPLVPFYPCGDRFIDTYKEDISFEEKLKRVSEIKEIKGIELSYPSECINHKELLPLLKKYSLEISNIEVDLFGKKEYKYGSLSANNSELRARAINETEKCIQYAKQVGCKQISLWLGQDGYDYPWQSNYSQAWDDLIKSLKKILEKEKKISIAVEYKPREPRNFIFTSTAAKCLYLFSKLPQENFGCLMDLGHSFNAKENPAEEAQILLKEKKLFHIHLNDNYGYWDDDLTIGSIHLSQTLEFLYTLRINEYDGWYSFDIFPYREEGSSSLKANVELLSKMIILVENIDENIINEHQKNNNTDELNKYILGKLLK